jgi:hypothetical protein
VYSAVVPKGQAIETAFGSAASDSKQLEEAALVLRRIILGAHQQSLVMPWPPSADFLMSDTVCPPSQLHELISVVITGITREKEKDSLQKSERLAKSFSEDICQAATRGKWTMPKHILLGMTLRHITGSAEVITLIHRHGHCKPYT